MRDRSPASCARPRPWSRISCSPSRSFSTLMFYVLLYQSRLVPRWLSSWGLVGAVLYIVPPLGSMFGHSLDVLMAPLALQEMVMAVWLIAKGTNPSAIAAESARKDVYAEGRCVRSVERHHGREGQGSPGADFLADPRIDGCLRLRARKRTQRQQHDVRREDPSPRVSETEYLARRATTEAEEASR